MFWKSKKKRIYMDYAAATPCSQTAQKAMHHVSHVYANPGAPHTDGLEAKKVLEDARSKIASVLAVKPQEVIFTSGATEANNVALCGVIEKAYDKRGARAHVVISAIEHSSVREVCDSKRITEKADVTLVTPNEHGCIEPETLKHALRENTCLVSIGWANGEIGTIQPMRGLAQTIREYEKRTGASIVFHSDTGQSAWAHSPQPHGVGLDIATYSSTKLYGPRGDAVLFIKRGVELSPLFHGGSQERGLRPGTEDPILAAGFAAAFAEGESMRARLYPQMRTLRTQFIRGLQHIEGCVINGTHSDQLPHIVNVSIPGIDSEYCMYVLDHAGIAMSTKSICLLESGDPVSPVVETLGGSEWRATNTLRFSFGRETTAPDIDTVVAVLTEHVKHVHAHTT